MKQFAENWDICMRRLNIRGQDARAMKGGRVARAYPEKKVAPYGILPDLC